MPKLKTHKGAASRFHITGSGRIMRNKIGASHLRLAKSKRTKRIYGQKLELNPADETRIKRLIPYGAK
ncbi:MAG: 50S ribosomal protein L35 [Chloroflexota bacterium]